MPEHDRNLIWIDLEMTGLDFQVNTIIEIATIVTTSDLEVVAEGPVMAIRQPEEELAKMDDWNVTHHTNSGLLERVRASSATLADAERLTLEFLREHTEENKSPLCGNSIWQDRHFLKWHMPGLERYFHYRCIDVSAIKELVRRWYPPEQQAPPKQGTHTALSDIRESIAELRYYRDNLFIPRP